MNRQTRIVLGLYLFLTLLLSWPLPSKIFTHVPGVAQWAFDESTFIWNIWYLKHALVDQLSNPLHTELIYYPLGIDLILYTYNFYHALAAQPLFVAVNLPFASNLTLLASTFLSAFGTYLLSRYLLRHHFGTAFRNPAQTAYLAPMLAGILYAFATNRAIYAALGHYDMVTTQWIPFYALALLQSLDEHRRQSRRRRSAVLAGIFFAFNGLAEMITALFMAIFTLIVIFVWLSGKHRSQSERRERRLPVLITSLAIIGFTGAFLWGPVLVPIIYQFIRDDFSLKGWGEAIPLSTDLLGWFTPSVLHPVFGSDLVEELRRVKERALEPGVGGFRDVNTVFIGWISLLLALVGAFRFRRKVSIWIWALLLFGIFTLGPFLQINGQYRFNLDGVDATITLPYALLHYIPIVKANRAPNRNSVVLMLAVAVLAAFALAWGLSRVKDRRVLWTRVIGTTLLALIVFEHLAVPIPLSDARVPQVYAQIAADPKPVSVLQLPLGWRNSFGTFGPERTRIQYYQTVHHKPMLGGNISRAPDYKLEYFARLPFFQAMRNVQSGHQLDEALRVAAEAQAEELMYLYNIGYVILFPPIENRPPYSDNWEASWRFTKEMIALEESPFWKAGGIEAYRVLQPQGSDEFILDLGISGRQAYLGEGWDEAESDNPYGVSALWAVGSESRVFIPLRNVDREQAYEISVRLHPFVYPEAADRQTVDLVVNNVVLPSHVAAALPEWQILSWEVTGSQLLESINRINLGWEWSARPRDVVPGERVIGDTGKELPVDVDIKGFADGGFIALFDEEGEQANGSLGRKGINITALDPNSGEIVHMAGFDTTANLYESRALAAFLDTIPPGYPVIIVSYGEAWKHLSQEAIDSMRKVGVDLSEDALSHRYLAAVGVRGSAPGTAEVVLDASEAFLRIGLNRDRRPLSAAVDWVKIEPLD